jgi:hypothetical protein
LRQVQRENRDGRPWLIAHRRNSEEWLATLPLRDLLELLAKDRRAA